MPAWLQSLEPRKWHDYHWSSVCRNLKAVAQYAWQEQLIKHLVKGNNHSPLVLSISPHPYVWYLVLTRALGPPLSVKGASWRLRFHLNLDGLDSFLGCSVLPLQGKSPKHMQFAQLQVGASLNNRKQNLAGTQPCGSVEFNRLNSAMTLKCSAALFRGDSLLRGHVDMPYPSLDPPSGAARWVYSLAARTWVDPRSSSRATKRTLMDMYGGNHIEWGLSSV